MRADTNHTGSKGLRERFLPPTEPRVQPYRDTLSNLEKQLSAREGCLYRPLWLELRERLKAVIETPDAPILEDLSRTLRGFQRSEEDSLVFIRNKRRVASGNLSNTPGYADKGKAGAEQFIYKDVNAHRGDRDRINSWALTGEEQLLRSALSNLGIHCQDDLGRFINSPPPPPEKYPRWNFWGPTEPCHISPRAYKNALTFLDDVGDRLAALFEKLEEEPGLWAQKAEYRQEEATANAKYLALLRNIENANLKDPDICQEIQRSAMMTMLECSGNEMIKCFAACHQEHPDIVTQEMLCLAEKLALVKTLKEQVHAWLLDALVIKEWPNEWKNTYNHFCAVECFLRDFALTPTTVLTPNEICKISSCLPSLRQPTNQGDPIAYCLK